jgi:hypothetical protein
MKKPVHLITDAKKSIKRIYRVRPKKRRKPYLRYLWLDLNKRKTGINHFKGTISTIYTFFFKK